MTSISFNSPSATAMTSSISPAPIWFSISEILLRRQCFTLTDNNQIRNFGSLACFQGRLGLPWDVMFYFRLVGPFPGPFFVYLIFSNLLLDSQENVPILRKFDLCSFRRECNRLVRFKDLGI